MLHQHAPAFAHHFLTTNQVIHGNKHVLAPHRAILERHIQRQVAIAHCQPFGVTWNQCQGDAPVFFATQQAFGVLQLEGQANHRGHRRQGNVALVEIEANTKHFLAIDRLLADHAGIGNGGGIGTGGGGGQGKTGDFLTHRQAGQIIIFLLLGAVFFQQLRRPQGIGHRHVRSHHGGTAGQLLQHRRMGHGGKFQTAVFLGNNHAEKLVFLDKVPHFRRHVTFFVTDFPVVNHGAQFTHRPVHERLLLGTQFRLGNLVQLVKIWLATENFAVPAHIAGFQRHALGVRQLGQGLLVKFQERLGQVVLTRGLMQQHKSHRAKQQPGQQY